MFLETLAELAVVIDEDLRVGRKLHAEAAADERGVSAEIDAGYRRAYQWRSSRYC